MSPTPGLPASLLQMLASGVLPLSERLRVLLTALEILQGQGEALNVDRRQLYLQLYQTLMLVPLAPLAEDPGVHYGHGGHSKAAGVANGHGGSAAGEAGAAGQQREQQEEDEQEDERAVMALHASSSGSGSADGSGEPVAVRLVRCMERLLLGSKQTDVARLAAFTKRLAGLLLHAGPGECLGLAALLLRLIKRYPRLAAQLEWDGGAPVGGRAFNADCTDPTEAGALAAALWELPLALRHYHPHVAAAAKSLLELSPAAGAGAGTGGTTGPLATAAGPQELALAYDSASTGRFKPTPAAPPRRNSAALHSKAAVQRLAAVAARPLCAELAREVGGHEAVAAGPGPKSATANGVRSSARAAWAADGFASSGEGEAEASEAVLRHFRTTRRWQQNRALRRQVALEAARLRRFQEHLIQLRETEKLREEEQAATAAAAAAAAKSKQAAAAAEPGSIQQQQQQQKHKRKHSAQQPSAVNKKHAFANGLQPKPTKQKRQS